MKLRRYLAVGGWFLFILLASFSAQAGPLTGFTQWVQGNVVTDLSTLAVFGIAIALFAFHVHWGWVIGICGGIWVAMNAQQLVGILQAG